MRKDNRKFMVSVKGVVRFSEITSDDLHWVIKGLLGACYTLDQIQVWKEANIRLVPERYVVD